MDFNGVTVIDLDAGVVDFLDGIDVVATII